MPLVNVVNELHSDEALFWLLTFTDPTNKVVLRAVNNLEAVVSNNDTYEAFPFEVTLSPDTGDKPTEVKISFPNVGQELMKLVREYMPDKTPSVRLDLVLSSDPDQIEKTVDFLRVSTANYDAKNISFTLASATTFGRKTSLNTYNQYEFPGLFFALR